jgi:hypothetical protein
MPYGTTAVSSCEWCGWVRSNGKTPYFLKLGHCCCKFPVSVTSQDIHNSGVRKPVFTCYIPILLHLIESGQCDLFSPGQWWCYIID